MTSHSTSGTAGAGSSVEDVAALLNPKSVAIVGATPRVEAIGGRPIVNLRTQGFGGRIYPVNPRYDEILGLRCFPDLLALPEPPDVVMVLVGPDRIFPTLDEALAARARVAMVFAAGFAEVSGEGADRQERLRSYRERGLRICGPNFNGIFSVSHRTALGFTPSFEFPARRGSIGLIAQSGNVSTCISSRGMEMGVGFSHVVATGNEVDLEATDFVEYMLDDPTTEVLALFVEGFKDPPRFLAAAEAALRRGKPMVVMKMGRTAASQRVALSHTGTMTGSYEVLAGALRQKGVVVVDGLDELWGVASLFATRKRPQGGALAVASLSGGLAGILADACEAHGVALAALSAATEAALAKELPGVANLANPLDMTGQVVNEPDCWKRCIDILAADPGVDVLVSALSITANQIERRFAEDVVALAARSDVVQVCVWSSGSPPHSGVEVLKEGPVVVYTRVDDAVAALSAWHRYWSTRDRRIAALDARAAPPAPTAHGGGISGWDLLGEAGIPVAPQRLIRRREDLPGALSVTGYPVALKLEAGAAAHKTELGALRLGLRSEAEAFAAFDELAGLLARLGDGDSAGGILVQAMFPGKRELILGLKHEPGVGLAVVAGSGGIFAEIHHDVAIRVAPLTHFDAEEMLDELAGRRMLDGVRGMAPVRRALLTDVLLRLSDLALRHGSWIGELDINPLILRDDGSACAAVDVLVGARAARTPAG